MAEALVVEGLAAGYGDLLAVRDVTFRVAPGEVLAIVGRNGVGKSTTVNAVAGLLPIAHGTVRFGDTDISRFPTFQRARMGIGLVPEGRRIFRTLSVEDNLLLGTHALDPSRGSTRESLAKIYRDFPMLFEHKAMLASLLSGGQQQLLSIAQTLIAKPHVVLADEPTAGLSPSAVTSVFDAIRRLAAEGIGVVVIEERVDHLTDVADRTLRFEHGRITGEL